MIAVGLPPILFQGRATTNQAMTAAFTWYQIALAAEDYDLTDAHSTASNTGRFVAPRAGQYKVSGSLLWNNGEGSSVNTTNRAGRIVKNGSTQAGPSQTLGSYVQNPTTTAGIFYTQHFPVFEVPLVAGDYLELQAFAGLAGANLYGSSADGSLLRVEWMRY